MSKSLDVVYVADLMEDLEIAINATGDLDRGLFPSVQERVNSTLVRCHEHLAKEVDAGLSLKPPQ